MSTSEYLLEVSGKRHDILTRRAVLFPMIWLIQQRPVHRKLVRRALRRIASHGLRRLAPHGFARVRFGDDTCFSFPITDEYWGRLVYMDANPYEYEIESILRTFSDIPYIFFDLGANFGYWSTRVTGEEFGTHKALAVEASISTTRILSHNQIENSGRFDVVCNAIGNSEGQVVEISGASHAGKSITFRTGGDVERVETVTIDSLAREYATATSPLVVKLDVEGAETAAIEGASATLECDTLLIYEDHGKDEEHTVSALLLKRAGKVFHYDGRVLSEIENVRELDRIKINRVVGYNFIYTQSPFWLKLIDERLKEGLA